MNVGDSPQFSRPTGETPRSPVTSRRDKPTKDLIQGGLKIQQRLREKRLAKQASREQQAEKNREAYPWTAGCLSMTRSRFKGASVIGFAESGVSRGTPDVFSEAMPVPQRYAAKAPKAPRGLSVNKGRKQEMFDD